MSRRKTEMLLFRWLLPHHFVFIMSTLIILTLIFGYCISVGIGKVNAVFPYISDTGTKPPASCVFGFLLNIASAMTLIVMYIRHAHFEKLNSLQFPRLHALNDISFFIGLLSCFGMMIVACFQETNVLSIHMVGAVMAFVLGIIYCWFQCYLSFAMVAVSSKTNLFVRIILSTCATICFLMVVVGARCARSQADKGKPIINLDWKSKDPGYAAHLVSTFAEWIMAVCFVLFFVTFYHEFKTVESNVDIRTAHGLFMEDTAEDNVVEVLS